MSQVLQDHGVPVAGLYYNCILSLGAQHTVNMYCIYLTLTKVYLQKFYMKDCTHPNPKKSLTWSTTPYIRAFDMGNVTGEQRRATLKSTKVYLDHAGRKKYQGNENLKATGSPGFKL